ncbi:MAG: glycerol-3-phosphate dehydrogenase [NAD(P)+] 2 [Candidatus Hydrogenedentota bacterium]
MKIQVVGGGSWGLALARLLAKNGHAVRLWCREEDDPQHLRETRQSRYFLPGVAMPDSIDVSPEADIHADMAVLAVPSHAMRGAISRFRFPKETILVNVAKGIENETLLCMHEVIRTVYGPCTVATLSGPSHAEEVAKDLPATLVAASEDHAVAEMVQQTFMADTFRVYTSDDITGVELGGSIKNVIAVAAGVCDAFGLGDNAKAALITRGLAEMARLGAAMGAHPLTFSGLSGMGDLIVTCESRHSRNRAFGERIARGERIEEFEKSTHMVAEGVRTAKSAHALAVRHNVPMPITEQVYQVIYENADPREAVAALMQRDAKPERQ